MIFSVNNFTSGCHLVCGSGLSALIYFQIIALGCLAISVLALVYDPIIKLRIWQWFDNTIPNFPPIVAIVAACLMILTPIVGVVGVVRNNQKTIMMVCMIILHSYIPTCS